MTLFKLCFAFGLLTPAVALAAGGPRPVPHDTHDTHASAEMAALDEPLLRPGTASPATDPVTPEAVSPAPEDLDLPDLPEIAARPALNLTVTEGPQSLPGAARENRFSVVPAASISMLTMMESTPLAGPARYLHAQRFNTDDGSSVDGFAICYRLNRRSSLQVVPGDPTPNKLPVSTVANNMGVTVGMVMKLSKSR